LRRCRPRAAQGKGTARARRAEQQLRLRRHECLSDHEGGVRRLLLAAAGLVLAAMTALYFLWWGPGPKPGPHTVMVQEGSSLGAVVRQLEKAGAIPGTSRTFYVMARILGSRDPIQAGEFEIPRGMGGAAVLDLIQHGRPVQRLITVTEGMPSIMV